MNEQGRLLAEVNKRIKANFAFKSFGSGLSTAGQYMKGWFDCLDSDSCNYLKNIDMQEAVKRANNTLTWCDSKSTPEDAEKTVDVDATLKRFKLPDGVTIPKNSLMVFRNVITTNEEDRDGDVLHTRGAKIDTPMPLLWQHNSALPIGKMLSVDKHDDKVLRVFSVLLDMNDLTEDTAKLIEAGAMRISHGFIPLKFEERAEDSKNVPWAGFDIRSFEIMEESVVSVPSNRGAVIDMFTRDGFKSQEMKTIGKLLERKETGKVWPGFELFEQKRAAMQDASTVAGKDSSQAASEVAACKCGGSCGTDACKSTSIDFEVTIDKTDGNRTESIALHGDESLEEKLIELKLIKGGRELSKANLQLLRDIVADLKELKDAEGLSRSHVALINKNIGSLEALIDKNSDEAEEGKSHSKGQPEDPIEGEEALLEGETEDTTKKPPQSGDDDDDEEEEDDADEDEEGKDYSTTIRFITFDADEDQLKAIEEILAARKEIEESIQVGKEFRELVNN